jgi:hypothetical protein
MSSALGFPSSPTLNQQYTIGSKIYSWSGDIWQLVSTPGLTQEQVQDYIDPLFTHSSHSNITATYDDAANKIILSASGGSGGSADIGLIVGLS